MISNLKTLRSQIVTLKKCWLKKVNLEVANCVINIKITESILKFKRY